MSSTTSHRERRRGWLGVMATQQLAARREQIFFVVVGIWNTAFAYSVWALLQLLLQERLSNAAILVLAWPAAVLNAFICHRTLTFRSTGSIRHEFPRFALVYVVTLLANIILLPTLLNTLPFSIFAIQAGYTVVVVVASYLAHRLVSFRPAKGQVLTEQRHER
jgi:putative flippase GtrA